MYRPNSKEILQYIHDLVNHKLIRVRTNTAYLSHAGIGPNIVVTTSQGTLKVRALAFAPGAHETTAGAPHLPIEPREITNGACILHSSAVNEYATMFYSAATKYVVGASKAAIDLMETFEPEDGSVVWAHRGHVVFHNRDNLHAALKVAAPMPASTRHDAGVMTLTSSPHLSSLWWCGSKSPIM